MSTDITTALVTGGSRGIGAAVAKRLAKDGFQVYLTYVSKPELAQAVCDEIIAAGGKAQAFCLNVADRQAVSTFFADEIKNKVKLGVLVNNAGITKDGLLIRMKDEDWDKVIAVNLTGAFTCLREAAKIMSRQRNGRIINIASVVAQSGNAGQANYVAAKAGLIGLTKTAAQELAGRGVTVNAVTPGYIETDMTSDLPDAAKDQFITKIPAKRAGQADDVAGACAYLASQDAAYVTGQVISVNGGLYM
ncbi:3-oxoacyl-[acyl-carrier-protein] reductase [Desulfovibrio inopinatus]|uniref:3-oxoacyl-[acyl-carrier-protein] reductase n=1 Tax=Desulfovibrio inopinatus TaxID=102109 RepID=UPI0004236321|nr:3-oxoacyl-[acyl-carrier-protein] reductase [Desulfovibrio inopinatus]